MYKKIFFMILIGLIDCSYAMEEKIIADQKIKKWFEAARHIEIKGKIAFKIEPSQEWQISHDVNSNFFEFNRWNELIIHNEGEQQEPVQMSRPRIWYKLKVDDKKLNLTSSQQWPKLTKIPNLYLDSIPSRIYIRGDLSDISYNFFASRKRCINIENVRISRAQIYLCDDSCSYSKQKTDVINNMVWEGIKLKKKYKPISAKHVIWFIYNNEKVNKKSLFDNLPIELLTHILNLAPNTFLNICNFPNNKHLWKKPPYDSIDHIPECLPDPGCYLEGVLSIKVKQRSPVVLDFIVMPVLWLWVDSGDVTIRNSRFYRIVLCVTEKGRVIFENCQVDSIVPRIGHKDERVKLDGLKERRIIINPPTAIEQLFTTIISVFKRLH